MLKLSLTECATDPQLLVNNNCQLIILPNQHPECRLSTIQNTRHIKVKLYDKNCDDDDDNDDKTSAGCVPPAC